MKSVLIIGASRGLGQEFFRQYREAGWRTFGTVRSLRADTSAQHGLFTLDVTHSNDFDNVSRALHGVDLDVCIYNAGVLGPQNEGAVPCAEAEFDAVMHTNVLGALRAIPAVAPHLTNRAGKFVFISSRMGSIGLQDSDRRVVYRASKAALNAVMKTAAIEWTPKGLIFASLHPGWVKTDMGGSDADIDVTTSILGMRRVIDGLTAADSGHFLDYTGEELAW